MASALGFKARVDHSLICNGFLRFISGATPAGVLTASIATEPSLSSDTVLNIDGIQLGEKSVTVQHSVCSNHRDHSCAGGLLRIIFVGAFIITLIIFN